MLDSGATCSAGPEGSINRLIAAVLERDHKAAVTVDAQKRPKFRYGSGKWGKALYQVTISSSLSSNSFQAFALPDPEESKEPWFEESTMLVPVLVGMDFIYSNGMIIDFHDGHTICAAQEQPRPFHLPRNNKGHYMVDLVDFLTEGDLCHEGHPQIHVLVEDGTASTIDLSNSQWVSSRGIHSVIFTHQFEAQVMQVPGSRNHEQLFASVIDRRMRLMNRQTGLMGSLLSKTTPATSSSLTTHGDQEGEGSEGAGLRERSSDGPQGSSQLRDSMALYGPSHGAEAQVKSVGSMEDVCKMRPTPVLHSDQGISRTPCHQPESRSGEESSGPTSEGNAPRNANRGRSRAGHGGESDCRGAHDQADGGVREDLEESNFQDRECKGEDDCGEGCSQEWSRQFRKQRLSATTFAETNLTVRELGSCEPSSRGPPGPAHDRGETTAARSSDAAQDGTGQGREDGNSPRAGLRLGQLKAVLQPEEGLPPEEGLSRPLPLRLGNHMLNLMYHVQNDIDLKMADMVYDSKP